MITDIKQDTGHSIRAICGCLKLARSSYYHAATPTLRQSSDQQIGDRVADIFHRHRSRYGYRRIYQELSDEGIRCSRDRVRRLMGERDLNALQPKSFAPRTSDGRADKPCENLLVNNLPKRPNEALAEDITHIQVGEGWLYLAVVIDLCSRRVVGWKLADHMRSELVVGALDQALQSTERRPNRIFHSDRGSQYGSKAFRETMSRTGMAQSMSARANPYDNAWTESFIGTMKAEMLQGGRFETEEDARTELFAYLDSYYNTKRKHSSLGYLTPAEFEAQTLSLN